MAKLIDFLFGLPRVLYAVAALVFVGSLLWGGRQPVAVGLFPPPYDLLAHLVAYGVLTALCWFALGRPSPWLVVAAVGLVALLDECQQLFLPGRHANLLDGAMDLVAAVVVVIILNLATRKIILPATSDERQ